MKMKIIDTSFNEQLKNKTLKVGADSFLSEEATIKFTGNTRRIKDIFGKVKEQSEFYLIKRKYSMWNSEEYKTIKQGPYWKKI